MQSHDQTYDEAD